MSVCSTDGHCKDCGGAAKSCVKPANADSGKCGVPVTALRYHNVYGSRMPADTPYAGVAAIFRSSVERGEPPTVYEDGGQTRDFVHVRDVARANAAALVTPDPVDGPLNDPAWPGAAGEWDRMAGSGVEAVRTAFYWHSIQPTGPA